MHHSLRRCTLTSSVLDDQDHAEPRLSPHHLCVRRRRLVQRSGLDHGGDTAQRTETERCVTSRRVPGQGAFELATPEYEIHARDLDRLRADAEVNRDTAGTQALEGCGNCLAPGSRYQNDLGAAERLQSRGGIGTVLVFDKGSAALANTVEVQEAGVGWISALPYSVWSQYS